MVTIGRSTKRSVQGMRQQTLNHPTGYIALLGKEMQVPCSTPGLKESLEKIVESGLLALDISRAGTQSTGLISKFISKVEKQMRSVPFLLPSVKASKMS